MAGHKLTYIDHNKPEPTEKRPKCRYCGSTLKPHFRVELINGKLHRWRTGYGLQSDGHFCNDVCCRNYANFAVISNIYTTVRTDAAGRTFREISLGTIMLNRTLLSEVK